MICAAERARGMGMAMEARASTRSARLATAVCARFAASILRGFCGTNPGRSAERARDVQMVVKVRTRAGSGKGRRAATGVIPQIFY